MVWPPAAAGTVSPGCDSESAEDQFRRDKTLSLELLAALTELIGSKSQIGEVDTRYLGSLEAPAVLMLEGSPVMVFASSSSKRWWHPEWFQRIALEDLQRPR